VTRPEALPAALFLVVAFSASGWLQVRWLRSPRGAALRVPLDGGLELRGRRVFGAHKTLRGLLVMVPASGLACLALSLALGPFDAAAARLWALGPAGYLGLGLAGGLGFMLGELPNSFLKRQLGVPPGGAPRGRFTRALCFAGDRLDSVLGMLAGVHVAAGVPPGAWLAVLLAGPLVHWLFNVLLWRRGFKARPA
jgi:CDP-2,3-bis-(O-geranylgeranyl)-sn-glycerol synthase